MEFPTLSQEKLINRLSYPSGKVRIVLDTDTYNEIDDQFAVAYALASTERLKVEAIYAAPFRNRNCLDPGKGMELSYREIVKILDLYGSMPHSSVYKGSVSYLPGALDPVRSAAAEHLVETAMSATEEEPLYVVAIGAITNIASAILLEPRIIEKIVVVWLGGHSLHWSHTKEFNLFQDMHASRLVLNCGVPLVLFPCLGVTSHLTTTLAELEANLAGKGKVGEYLCDTFRACSPDHLAYSRVIWDLSTIAYLVNEKFASTKIMHSPVLTDQYTWSIDQSRHFIRYADYVYRNLIFKDLFNKIAGLQE